MTKVGFIKNWESLQEEYRSSPHGFEHEIEKFSDYIDKLPDSNAVLGFIGKFGTGKSALLEGVKKKREQVEEWLQFDAWKYPERNHMWENFTLELARNLFSSEYKLFQNRVDGKSRYPSLFKSLGNALGLASNVMILPGSGKVAEIATSLLTGFFERDPLIRLHEFHQLVKEIIGKSIRENSKNICIIVEDIDRSQDAGMFFLETLNQLLRDNKFSKRVIVIVPIGSDIYEANLDSYPKCLDFMYFSQLPNPAMYQFVDDVFNEDVFSVDDNSREQIVRFLDELIGLPDGNMRKIKLLLRDAAVVCEKMKSAEKQYDWRMIIGVIAMKYFKVTNPSDGFEGTYAKYYERSDMRFTNPFPRLFLAIARRTIDLNPRSEEHVKSFKFGETQTMLPETYLPRSENSQTNGQISNLYRDIMLVR